MSVCLCSSCEDQQDRRTVVKATEKEDELADVQVTITHHELFPRDEHRHLTKRTGVVKGNSYNLED